MGHRAGLAAIGLFVGYEGLTKRRSASRSPTVTRQPTGESQTRPAPAHINTLS